MKSFAANGLAQNAARTLPRRHSHFLHLGALLQDRTESACAAPGTGVVRILMAMARASLKPTDSSADQEFRGQNPLAEGHLRMMQTLQKHLHTAFADLLLLDADG